MSGSPNVSIDFEYVGRICLILLGLYLVSDFLAMYKAISCPSITESNL